MAGEVEEHREGRKVDSLGITMLFEEMEEAESRRRNVAEELEDVRKRLTKMPDKPHAAGTVEEAHTEKERLLAERACVEENLAALESEITGLEGQMRSLLEKILASGMPEKVWLAKGEHGVYLLPPESGEDTYLLYRARWDIIRRCNGASLQDIEQRSQEEEARLALPRRHRLVKKGSDEEFIAWIGRSICLLFFGGVFLQCLYNILVPGTVFWIFHLSLLCCLLTLLAVFWRIWVDVQWSDEMRAEMLRSRHIRIETGEGESFSSESFSSEDSPLPPASG